MLKKELIQVFRTAKPVLKSTSMDIKMATVPHERGHLIVITPRAVGNAPQRNRIRRRIKALFYEHNLFQKDRVWLFFIKKEGISLDFSALSQLVLATCQKR